MEKGENEDTGRTSQNVRSHERRIERRHAIPKLVEKQTLEQTQVRGDVLVGF